MLSKTCGAPETACSPCSGGSPPVLNTSRQNGDFLQKPLVAGKGLQPLPLLNPFSDQRKSAGVNSESPEFGTGLTGFEKL
jgi:hypothetical protein